jgi:hypothetical protein
MNGRDGRVRNEHAIAGEEAREPRKAAIAHRTGATRYIVDIPVPGKWIRQGGQGTFLIPEKQHGKKKIFRVLISPTAPVRAG